MLIVDILTLFPGFFYSPLQTSLLKRAIDSNLLNVKLTNIRDFSTDRNHKVDDRPFGGGPGMVMTPQPIKAAIDNVKSENSQVIYLSPQGDSLSPKLAKELAKQPHLVLLCGHYEGVDERVIQNVDREVSIGDYVLSSGNFAALVLLDAIMRYIPGSLGDARSSEQDSFEQNLFDHPQYTKPSNFRGEDVPQVLRSGNHLAIEKWRKMQATSKTLDLRPDHFMRYISKLLENKKSKSAKISLLLPVSDIECSIKFYKDIFGSQVDRLEEGYANISYNGVDLLLFQLPKEKVNSRVMHGLSVETGKQLEGLLRSIKRLEDKLDKTLLISTIEKGFSFLDPDSHLWVINLNK